MIVSLVPTPTEAFGIDTNSKQKAHCDIKKYQQKKFLKNLFLMQNFLTFKIKKKIIIIILMIQENVLSINFEKKKGCTTNYSSYVRNTISKHFSVLSKPCTSKLPDRNV